MLVRNAFKLLTGVLGAQLLSFLLLPVLTRLYSSSDFGELGVFISLSGLFALLMSLRLEQLILIDGFSQRKMTFSLSVSVIPLTSLFLISFILLSGSLSLPLYFSVELLFYSIVAGAFICLINSSYQFRLIENNINSASFITFSRIVSVLVFQFVFYLFNDSINGLLIGNLVAIILYSSYLTYKTVTKNNISVCSFNQLLRALKKNEKFIVFGTPQGLLNSLSQSLPLLIVGSAFSLPIAGQYFLALKVVQLPVVLCASAVRPLFLKEFSSFDFGVVGLQQKVISYTFYLSLIAIPVFLVLFQYSNFIFTLIFGQEWLLAGQIASILCIWLVICFINPPCTALLYRFKQVKFLFYYELALFMFRLCSMYLGVKTGSLIATVTYFVVVGVLMNLILIIYTCYLAKKIETQI